MKADKIEQIFKKYTKVEELTVTQRGKAVTRERVVRPDAVCAVVYDTKKEKFVFVKQYRPGHDGLLVELVAGKIDGDEKPIIAMIREIEEEIGYEVDKIEELVPFFYASPGYSTERLIIYYVEVSKQTSTGGGVATENEEIEILYHGRLETKKMIETGEICDGKTLLGMVHTWRR